MKKVCFVCLGNICRSPMAEFVMKSMASPDELQVESRATSGWEHGNPIHHGTQSLLQQYQISYDTRKTSQQITSLDFEAFDYIIGMDSHNIRDLKQMSKHQWDSKIHLFIEGGVPDPWYTGDFEETYRLVKVGCQHWLSQISAERESHVEIDE
ncbi:TPA: low molecular weight phosphotyrosine protein phosphatase [Streptococcus equi subsp. zooepidemicus]|uniref:low molecular weight protein-tyrosine-phosphatase n=1 Tax=Streptococcus equi TaxID=1336 RepID=UPI0024A85DA5|nr:low molecular weight protein-tyrosine-phosphatase [Streptococcus equi]MDI5952739.1 low molecular weight protein-tyrosine-phosphatase [Streptococcus equi subsp. zooepidemicus]MDI6074678.1 low molecular weight protein-tyrosine-phosphatase [Streptococcus equi subsp. zooepidemicus]HEK9955136.1 low molecular weight phosphotyrosine protein phosphatase [Streptococcus equi subsp. zooepidemicus]HEK9993774.1 low molecular weight phosphotyrosine protein phosphatase [Streptococcus equi subsp. zooepidemi